MFIVTRLFRFKGYVDSRGYLEVYRHPCGVEMARWPEGDTARQREASRFSSVRDALAAVAKHVPEKNQHRCEVIRIA